MLRLQAGDAAGRQPPRRHAPQRPAARPGTSLPLLSEGLHALAVFAAGIPRRASAGTHHKVGPGVASRPKDSVVVVVVVVVGMWSVWWHWQQQRLVGG